MSKAASGPTETLVVSAAAGPQLQVAHIWRDEVMAHKVIASPRRVTLGTGKKATFTIPDLGLPKNFAILAPVRGGYVLSLGPGMSGRVRMDGKELDVAELVQRRSAASAASDDDDYHKAEVHGGDWGVIELDGKGEHNLFFRFVVADPPLPPPGWRDTELLLPAIAFALILHTVLIAVTFKLREDGNSLAFPGKRELMTAYLVTRPEPDPPPAKSQEDSASKDGEKKSVRSATKGKKGKAGGEGEKPRASDPDPADIPPEIETGLLSEESQQIIRKVTVNQALDDKLKRGLARLQGDRRMGDFGSGPGSGTGFGPDQGGTGTTRGGKPGGPGGGGSVQGDVVSQGKIDTGETRRPKGDGGSGRGPTEVAVVGTGDAEGDLGGLTKEEIDRVIRSRKGLIRACYQRELNRTHGLGGKLVVNFRIKADGQVQSVRVVPGKSSLRNPKVESCVVRQITTLKFPAKGGGVVNYPFIFSQG